MTVTSPTYHPKKSTRDGGCRCKPSANGLPSGALDGDQLYGWHLELFEAHALAKAAFSDLPCGRYCPDGETTNRAAEADKLGHLQGCQQGHATCTVETADADGAIEKAAKEFKVIASNLIAVPRR